MATTEELIKQVQGELGKTFEEFKKANDQSIQEAEKRGGEALAETESKVTALNDKLSELTKELRSLETKKNRPAKTTDGEGGEELTPEKELRSKAYEKYIRFGVGETGRTHFAEEELRALSGTSDADGNFLVPDEFETTIIMNAFNLAVLRPLVQVGTTSRDNVKLGALSKPIVGWGSRGLSVSDQQLNTGGVQIPIKNVRALALLSNDTLDDSAADVMGELESGFELAVAEAEDDGFIAGTNPDEPSGILANTSVLANVTNTGVANAIADGSNNGFDALSQMVYALNSTYRRNAYFAMNSQTEGAYRRLKDSDGRYLWDTALDTAGSPTLYGRPVVNPEGMPDVAANAYPVLFGDFRSGYKVRDRSGLVIQRLVERYAEFDQTGFLLKKRVGGNVCLPEAFRVLRVAA